MRVALLLFTLLFSATLANAAEPAVRDIDGNLLSPFEPDAAAMAVFFVCTDCPVSNFYAPEIQRICREYRPRGVACALVYEDSKVDAASVRRHLAEYGYRGIPAAIDSARDVAARAGATVTPEAVVVDQRGNVRYRGRIDNFYAALGRPRREVTERYVRDALDAVLAGKPVRTPETKALGCYIAPAGILAEER